MDVAHGIGSQTNNPEGGAGSVSPWLHTHAIPTTRHAPATPAQIRRLLSRGTRGAGGGSGEAGAGMGAGAAATVGGLPRLGLLRAHARSRAWGVLPGSSVVSSSGPQP